MPPAPPACEEKELHRAAVMFPRLFLWVIGAGIVALTSLGGLVVAQQRTEGEQQRQKVTEHEKQMGDHEARLRLLEQAAKDLKDTATETRQDVKEIRRLIEDRIPRRGER